MLCGPLGGPHTETGMFGSVGEGLEAVIVGPAVKGKGSCPSPGNPDPIWDLGFGSLIRWGRSSSQFEGLLSPGVEFSLAWFFFLQPNDARGKHLIMYISFGNNALFTVILIKVRFKFLK